MWVDYCRTRRQSSVVCLVIHFDSKHLSPEMITTMTMVPIITTIENETTRDQATQVSQYSPFVTIVVGILFDIVRTGDHSRL